MPGFLSSKLAGLNCFFNFTTKEFAKLAKQRLDEVRFPNPVLEVSPIFESFFVNMFVGTYHRESLGA